MSDTPDYDALISEFFNSVPDQEIDVIDIDTLSEEERKKIENSETNDIDDTEDNQNNVESKEDVVDKSAKSSRKLKRRINTTKVFDNSSFYTGGLCEEIPDSSPIRLSPVISDQYDYSISEDIVLLQERKDTAQIIYEIFNTAPFADSFKDPFTGIIKIPKADIQRVFYYVKDRLLKRKNISTFECVIAICEFFDMSYDYVVKKVLSSKMISMLMEDYYNNMGMKRRIDEQAVDPLF